MTSQEPPREPDPKESDEAMTVASPLQEVYSPEVARARHPGQFAFLNTAVVSADQAFLLLGINRSTGYKAIREGTFPLPVLRIGRSIRVPTVPLQKLLGADGIDDPPDEAVEERS